MIGSLPVEARGQRVVASGRGFTMVPPMKGEAWSRPLRDFATGVVDFSGRMPSFVIQTHPGRILSEGS